MEKVMRGEARRMYKSNITLGKRIKRALRMSAVVAFAAMTVLTTGSSQTHAWATAQSAEAVCQGNEAVINWSFKSEYKGGYPIPGTNKESATIKLWATDARTGKKYGPYTVAPQQTINHTIKTGVNRINKNDIRIEMEYAYWHKKAMRDTITITRTTGTTKVTMTPDEYAKKYNLTAAQLKATFGEDSRVASYNATPKCVVPHVTPTDFNPVLICELDGEGAAQYRLKIRNISGTDANFSPVNNSIHETGEAKTVTATYSDGPYGNKTVTKQTNSAEDCTPPAPEVVAVCDALKRISTQDESIRYGVTATVQNADIKGYKFLVNNEIQQESDSNSFSFDETEPGTYLVSAEVIVGVDNEEMVVTSEACTDSVTIQEPEVEMCEVAGKENLEADDPDCKETVKPAVKKTKKEAEMCEVAGKTHLTADDKDCVADVLPNTGPMSALLSFVGSGALATSIRSWYISKRSLRSAQVR